jgi:hypothetical protein
VKGMVVSAWRDDGGGYPLAILFFFHKSNIRLCKSPHILSNALYFTIALNLFAILRSVKLLGNGPQMVDLVFHFSKKTLFIIHMIKRWLLI